MSPQPRTSKITQTLVDSVEFERNIGAQRQEQDPKIEKQEQLIEVSLDQV